MKKLAVITGASSGIGKATAIKLSKEGHPLLLLSRRKHLLEELNLPNTICKHLDVTDLENFQLAITDAENKYGKTDLLINNAGIMLLGDSFKQNISEWNDMIDTNIKGVLNGISCVLNDMKTRKTGTIINISSIAGRKTFDNHSVYCATKYAVHAISESIREEVSNFNVRVSVIAPGIVETSLLKHTTNKSIKNDYVDMKKAMGGGIEADNIADTIFFIYSQPQNLCIREIVVAPTKQKS
ncbi:SDR family oxidoreductase [uncultured Clostridium sp.]|jgi:NADP-dependent 3-hydroxy acid dehydrogenase YdfG|uniref:SDR family oxidoreductase n=1 Tax=uncultured Clostridium sp. TaxID=59620 RepID=UPI00262185E8|nr:SDR family oxidoreductase [uncultured Clostridium sp.]